MVETDPIQIDKIQRKLRHRYMLLVGLNIIAYLTVIAFCIVGCNKIGGYSGNSYAFDEYWLYGGLAGLPGIILRKYPILKKEGEKHEICN